MSNDTVEIPNRPTPEHLAGLFAKHGLGPTRGAYFAEIRGRICGCEVSAMLADAAGGVPAAMALHYNRACYGIRAEVADLTGLPEEYVRGVDVGFTCGAMSAYRPGPPEFRAGLDDGIAANRIVFGGREDGP